MWKEQFKFCLLPRQLHWSSCKSKWAIRAMRVSHASHQRLNSWTLCTAGSCSWTADCWLQCRLRAVRIYKRRMAHLAWKKLPQLPGQSEKRVPGKELINQGDLRRPSDYNSFKCSVHSISSWRDVLSLCFSGENVVWLNQVIFFGWLRKSPGSNDQTDAQGVLSGIEKILKTGIA